MSTPTSSTEPAGVDAGDSRWFNEHVHVHDSALKTYLRQSFPSARADVDDVVQESYLRLWRSRTKQPLDSVRAFLFRVARNVALDLVRRARISPVRNSGESGVEFVLDDGPDVAESVSRAELVRAITMALAELPRRSREVLVLRKFRGFSQRETADRLGISEKTVEDHMTRGMKKLGARLRAAGHAELFPR